MEHALQELTSRGKGGKWSINNKGRLEIKLSEATHV